LRTTSLFKIGSFIIFRSLTKPGMRHALVHRYFEMDTNLVWSVVESDLPELKRKIAAILEEL